MQFIKKMHSIFKLGANGHNYKNNDTTTKL